MVDGANETRGDSYFPAPGYDNQHSYGKEYKTGATVHLPVDKRYGGLVQAPLDAQGRRTACRATPGTTATPSW